MAVDVYPPKTVTASALDRMAVASLAGTAYALGTLGIVFYLVPSLWDTGNNTVLAIVRGLVQIVALGGLIVFGVKLLGPRVAHGVRAGIFVGLVGFFFVLLLTRWASLWIEHWSFGRGLITPSVGSILTGVVGLALLALGVRLFLRPTAEKLLIRFEDQGWFTAKAYKGLQGQRVRRGTIFGILIIVGAGIYTMLAHNTLRKGPRDWQMNIPFTGRVTLDSPGDAQEELTKLFPEWKTQIPERSLVVDRYQLQEINRTIDSSTHVKVLEPGASDYSADAIVKREAFRDEVRKLKDSGQTPPTSTAPLPAGGPTTFRSLTLLPAVQFTLPLLLLAASLWLAWRIVNVPAFADFLIATEAEMNKVSWTTQRRLVQDTIVVLVTVVLMAFYLFAMDQTWRVLLSWKPIGVLIQPEEHQETNTNVENRPW
jgi:preprotein translocase SecE subunit